jgi:hypothetical protein
MEMDNISYHVQYLVWTVTLCVLAPSGLSHFHLSNNPHRAFVSLALFSAKQLG